MRAILLLLTWLVVALLLVLAVGPWLITTGEPELILLGFAMPVLFVLASVLGFIAWADATCHPARPSADETYPAGTEPPPAGVGISLCLCPPISPEVSP